MKNISIALAVCILALNTLLIKTNDRRFTDNHCYEPIKSLFPVDMQFNAGFAPVIWKNTSSLRAVLLNPLFGYKPITNPIALPSFSFFYKTPYTVGASLGYFPFDALRLSIKGNYYHAQAKKSKDTRISVSLADDDGRIDKVLLTFDMKNYHFYDAMLGIEYYSPFLSDTLLFHTGVTLGVTFHQKNYFSLTETIQGAPAPLSHIPASNPQLFIKNSVTPTIGANIGLDYNLFSRLYLCATVGFLACAGPKTNQVLPSAIAAISRSSGIPNFFLLSSIETEIKFPCTLGLRYDF